MKEPAYIDDTAAKTGCSRATVAREVHRGENIPYVAALAGTSLDKEGELDALAKLPADQQALLIKKAKAGKKVSAKASEAAKAEREVKRKEKNKKKCVERQAQEKAQQEEEKAREERALPATAYLRERLDEEQLTHFLALVDGHWDDFGRALEKEIMRGGEQREAGPGFGHSEEQAGSLSQQAVGRGTPPGIATDFRQ